MSDNVNHPDHYRGAAGLECIDVLHNFLTPDEFRGCCKGQAIEYILRERGKGGDEDIEKAIWWLEELVRPHYTLSRKIVKSVLAKLRNEERQGRLA